MFLISRFLNRISNTLFPRQKKIVYVPYMIPNQTVMDFYKIESMSCLKLNSWGVLEPPGEPDKRQEIPAMDAMIVPGLAFHQKGDKVLRLGRGGGYYDKFFEAYFLKHWNKLYDTEFDTLPYIIGVAFECQVVSENELERLGLKEFPYEKHDFCLDQLLHG